MAEDPTTELPAQSLVNHLLEFRSRLLRSLAVMGVFLVPLIYFSNEVFQFVAAPLLRYLPADAKSSMIVTDLTAAFLIPLKLSIFVSLFLSMPFLLYQVWAFTAPILYKKSRALARSLFLSSVVLFYMGVAFAYFVVFPLIFEFFTSVAPNSVRVMPDITSHLNLSVKLFFAFGVAFEIPVATVILILTGIVSPKDLEEKRGHVIVACFVIGMLLTPPDVFSQTMLAVPMWLMFEIGVYAGKVITRNQDQNEEESSD